MFKNPDYIVIGSGSAGSTIAYRLGENPKLKILVLEFGGLDKSPFIQMPAALSYPMNMDKFDWGYKAEPEQALNGRSLACPRGKVIGGSSSINGMIYVRGNAGDYNQWAESGAKGWDYPDVLPYFQRMEASHGGNSEFRGKSGPLNITHGKRDNPLHNAFVKATEQAGYTYTEDYNGFRQEGFGPADMNVWKGSRFSTAKAYLKPALAKKNVHLITKVLVDKIIFSEDKAKGVEVFHQGQKKIFNANIGVILSAGAINSPTILQRSGIGEANDLNNLGIKVIKNLPGVGKNLQDHLEVYVQQECKKPLTLYSYINKIKMVKVGRLTGLIALITATIIAPQLGSLGQVFQFIQEYTGVVSPGILAVFLMGLFYKKATNNASIWGVILSIPIAMYFKVAPNGWSESIIFLNLPFMHQMMLTCLGTLFVIYIISGIENKGDDPKGITLSKKLFQTDKTFNLAAFAVLLITALLYALFW